MHSSRSAADSEVGGDHSLVTGRERRGYQLPAVLRKKPPASM
jgi:hypothetical protein